MPIRLQGTVAFEPEFVGNLTMLTRTMIARGLDPDDYVIAKDIAAAPTLPFVGPIAYDYAVIAGETRIVITEAGDAGFLDEFLRHIGDVDGGAPPLAADGVFSRLTRWMSPQA
ncbi:MAG: hypothetical protein HZA66_26025 [Rhodopseudomonas palustris]|uniref:Uncharacterized protein n=1 Tax=Rhodopseudomonas palustris TaxID=1076 RepID=A0A933S338_RHOPL|nr:hypothetical protein [Rhodopseudomonas palustris]